MNRHEEDEIRRLVAESLARIKSSDAGAQEAITSQEAENTLLAQLVAENLGNTKRPYADGQYKALDGPQQERVLASETQLFLIVMANVSYNQHTIKVHAKGIVFGDEERVDEPLRLLRNLAQVYNETGLAKGEHQAMHMARDFQQAAQAELTKKGR